ncbi:MAG: ribonucleoside reductase [Alphaproteobacteria bacterium]|nr:ribonucleoside reductase [Alphaproteobacteria bacterium]
MTALSAIAHQIWDMKYRFKDPDGTLHDRAVEDTWRRVAKALSRAEKDPAAWEPVFYRALEDFRYLPAGRIVAGAGTARDVTLFNCFVMGTVPDSMAGIFEGLKEAALTLQQGGGIGYDFSTIRPKGALVEGVGADASGPLSFMDVWDSMCRTIMSAGSRRGAMMATLRCDHPDIEEFVTAKQEAGRLTNFNLSVLVTDAFMDAVKADEPWDLVFNGTVYRTLQARELWDKIAQATYDYAEPGVIFIDRINADNNLAYCETISATNPCVPAGTWVQTADGPRKVADLVGRSFGAIVGGVAYASTDAGFFSTGEKDLVRLTTVEGLELRLTPCHRIKRVVRKTRWSLESEWTAAGSLAPGDEVIVQDHGDAHVWDGAGDWNEGYLLGLLVGDGTLKQDKAVLSAWPRAQAANGGPAAGDGVGAVMRAAEAAIRTLGHRSDFTGWHEVAGRGEWRMTTGALRELAHRFGLAPGAKTVTESIEYASATFYLGFLRGLFDADGGVQGTQEKGVSIRLSQSDLPALKAVQRMLLRLGIMSRLYADRRPEGSARLPDGRGGAADYQTRSQHELVVSGENLERFSRRIGFGDSEKAARLSAALGTYKRRLNRERFVARIASVVADGTEEVFDATVPGIHAFDANGLLAHNCGEQPLPPYGACLLGSINLARLVDDPFTEKAAIDIHRLEELVGTAVRMMDNVVDLSKFPLDAQRQEARAKRRIGLGVTGLADALVMCGVRYGSDAAVVLTRTWMGALRRAAYGTSVELAKEKGPFPLFDREAYLARPQIQALDEDIRAGIAEHGIRNALLTSIAPTGTISLLADNVSSGVEPVFAWEYTRNVLQKDGSRTKETVSDYAYRLYRRLKGDDAPLTNAFVDAQSLTPAEHVVMQAAVQEFIDSSISKTINCPPDLSFEAFKDVYRLAYDSGCKGCTTYRPSDVRGAVLEVAPAPEPERAASPEHEVVYMTQPLERPEALTGKTHKIKWPDSPHALYITVNDIVQDGRRRPFEIFINSKNMEHYAWIVALTRMISAVFRRGGDVSFVVEELKAVFDPRGGMWMPPVPGVREKSAHVPSLLAAIGEVIEAHMIDIGFLPAKSAADRPAGPGGAAVGGKGCPSCGQRTLQRLEGCDTCTTCGYSKCA